MTEATETHPLEAVATFRATMKLVKIPLEVTNTLGIDHQSLVATPFALSDGELVIEVIPVEDERKHGYSHITQAFSTTPDSSYETLRVHLPFRPLVAVGYPVEKFPIQESAAADGYPKIARHAPRGGAVEIGQMEATGEKLTLHLDGLCPAKELSWESDYEQLFPNDKPSNYARALQPRFTVDGLLGGPNSKETLAAADFRPVLLAYDALNPDMGLTQWLEKEQIFDRFTTSDDPSLKGWIEDKYDITISTEMDTADETDDFLSGGLLDPDADENGDDNNTAGRGDPKSTIPLQFKTGPNVTNWQFPVPSAVRDVMELSAGEALSEEIGTVTDKYGNDHLAVIYTKTAGINGVERPVFQHNDTYTVRIDPSRFVLNTLGIGVKDDPSEVISGENRPTVTVVTPRWDTMALVPADAEAFGASPDTNAKWVLPREVGTTFIEEDSVKDLIGQDASATDTK